MTIVKNIKGYKTEIVIGTHMDFVDIAKQRGFNVMMEENDLLLGELQVAPDYLLLISSNLFSQHYELLNHMLQRRSRWLIPHM